MAAQIITVTNLKGGVGKTTTSYALSAAAVSRGLRVVAIDLDPTGGLSNALEKGSWTHTVADVLSGRVALRDALVDHPMGVVEAGKPSLLRVVRADRLLAKQPVGEALLQRVLHPVLDDCDLVIIDTQPHELAVKGPIKIAHHVVLPTAVDGLSVKALALTVGLGVEFQALPKFRGVVVTNLKRTGTMARIVENLLFSLRNLGITFDTVLPYSAAWIRATSGSGQLPEKPQLELACRLLDEVLTRPAPVEGWLKFYALARTKLAGAPRAAASGE